MFLRTLKRRIHRPKQRLIPLEQLARLWLDSPAPEFKGGSKIAERTWLHDEINVFYTRYIVSSLPSSDPAHPVIEEILALLDEQGDCPSITPGKTGGEDEFFAEISLLEYSLEVARIVYEMVTKAHRDPEMILGKIFITALGHQLGAVSDVETLGGIPEKSLLILDPLIRDLPYRGSIIEAIRTYNGNRQKTQEARILSAASGAAKKKLYERARVLSRVWNQPSIDIEEIKKAIREEGGSS